MVRSSLSRRIVQGVLVLFVPPTAVAGGVLLLLYSLDVHHHPAALLATLLTGGAVMITYLGFMIHGMGESLVATLREMHLGAELIATVNPAHRLQIQTGDELESLARAINQLADRLEAAQEGREAAVALATQDVAAERAMLMALVEALAEGVLLVTEDGRIGLANSAAHSLLDPGGPALLGRHLSDLADGADVRDRLARGRGSRERFALRGVGGARLEAIVTPCALGAERRAGTVMVLREASRRDCESAESDRANALSEGGAAAIHGRGLSFPGAGTRSGARTGSGPERPELYDVSLCAASASRVDPTDRDRPLVELECVVFDGETTGLDRDGRDRLVSLAGVRVRGGAVRRGEVFDALVNPGCAIPASIARLHGITDAMVADAPPIDTVLPAFLRFAEGAVLVGHQVWFDLRFLWREAERLGLPTASLTRPVLDTHLLAQAVSRQLEEIGLDGIAHRLGVSVEGRHSALGDALATAEIYVRLLELLRQRGIVTLGQILDRVPAAAS